MATQNLPRLSIALVSASALSYEILLMKLFAIIQWHHFAYMIISLALLGYGVSGTFLALLRERLLKHFSHAYLANIVLFAVSSFGCFIAAQNIPFNPLELFWDAKQSLRLLALYLLLSLPFFFAANAVALAFLRHNADISRLYAADMLGAGFGSLTILVLLNLFFPESILQIVTLVGLLAAFIAYSEVGLRSKYVLHSLLAVLILFLALPQRSVELKMNEYKDLSQMLRIKGAQIITEVPSAMGTLAVVQSPEVPFRYVPGLSIASVFEPLPQLGVFTNGDGLSAITHLPYSLRSFGYFEYRGSALPYHLGDPEEVLILGAGGGLDVLQAMYYGAKTIDAVEINPRMVELVTGNYADFAGNIYTREGVNVHIAEARAFVASAAKKFDLIEMAMVDSFGASSAGLQSLSENYLYTVEAVSSYLEHLESGGYLSISRWLKLPPRDSLKLVATVLRALREQGVAEPEKRIVLIRGWQTSTLLVKNGVFSPDEIAGLKRFCAARFFDTAYYDGMELSEANRYNVLEKPYFFQGIKAMLEDEADFFERYKFDVSPAIDNRPYFYHFFKWETLPEILALRGSGGMHLMEWGYLVLVAAFLQAVVASIVLILLPLLRYRRGATQEIAAGKTKVLLYFFALGLGFLFVEIYCIQRFMLFLSHPLTTVAIVLSSFLIFAGLGSGYSKRLSAVKGYEVTARLAITGVLLLGFVYAWLLDALFGALVTQHEFVKIAASMVLIAPLAFVMGMPFPMGLSELGKHSEALIPWAWGVNGCASVISAIAATLIAIHFGFTAVIFLALLFYLSAFASFPKRRGEGV